MAVDLRLNKLYTIMREAQLDIIALIPGPNLRYLTGGVHFVLERPIVMFLPLDEPPVAVIPQLEVTLFARHRLESRVYSWADAEGYEGAFKAAFEAMGVCGKTIGVDGLHMRFFEGEIIRRCAPEATIVEASDSLAELRIVKGPEEIAALRRAIQISEQGLQMTLDGVREGMSEIEIAAQLEMHLKALGGEGFPFHTIMHGGGNTALPHMGPLDYRIQHGDPLLFDFGATFDGYCADLTRTVFFGEVRDEFRKF